MCQWLDDLYSGKSVAATDVLPNGSFKEKKATDALKNKPADICANNFDWDPALESLEEADLDNFSAPTVDDVMMNRGDNCRGHQKSLKTRRASSKSKQLAAESGNPQR